MLQGKKFIGLHLSNEIEGEIALIRNDPSRCQPTCCRQAQMPKADKALQLYRKKKNPQGNDFPTKIVEFLFQNI